MAETADGVSSTVSHPSPESKSFFVKSLIDDLSGELEGSNTTTKLTDQTSEGASNDADLMKERESEKKSGGIPIWPPIQETRDLVLETLLKHMSSETFFSRKFGTVEPEKAKAIAKSIEQKAYAIVACDVALSESGLESYFNAIGSGLMDHGIKMRKAAEDAKKKVLDDKRNP